MQSAKSGAEQAPQVVALLERASFFVCMTDYGRLY